MQAGTQFRTLRRPGTVLHGLLRQQELTAHRQAPLNAVSSVKRTTIGTVLLRHALQQHNRQIARQNRRIRFGTIMEQTASSHRLGTARLGILQATHQLTIQRQEYADTNVQTTTTLKTVEQAAFPTQKQVSLVQVCPQMQAGTLFRA